MLCVIIFYCLFNILLSFSHFFNKIVVVKCLPDAGYILCGHLEGHFVLPIAIWRSHFSSDKGPDYVQKWDLFGRQDSGDLEYPLASKASSGHRSRSLAEGLLALSASWASIVCWLASRGQ